MPSISVIIPTLNSARVLDKCLLSIGEQNHPHELIEVIVADGGSTDRTLELVEEFKERFHDIRCTVVQNPLRTGEAGKAVGLKHATKEIIAFIDSDNILPEKDWFGRMLRPFKDTELIASEPFEYTYRREDGYITRYCALLGMNDPLCLFLGNYDRYCTLTGKWTELLVEAEDKGEYIKVTLNPKSIPTIGANGFLIRKTALDKAGIHDYFFDIDVLYTISGGSFIKIAKVKIGIIHIFSGNLSVFYRKQARRVADFLYYNKLGVRKYPWSKIDKIGLIRFILSCLFLFPLLIQSIRGYLKRPDIAWFFHPAACWITLYAYGWGSLKGFWHVGEISREGWKQ